MDVEVKWSATPASAAALFVPEAPFVPGFGETPPAPFGSGQLWAKRQPGGGSAVLFINHSPTPQSYSVTLAKLNLTKTSYTVKDIWERKETGTATGDLKFAAVPAYDSAFLLLTPA